jgi:malate dehydrogenase (oxaloacetate-decarboxylating)/malate dehydrogenase (oxaloacetate-decarboxylating)(NADP+)
MKLYTSKEVLDYHKKGKIGIHYTKPMDTQKDLSIAYSPGVAEVCSLIENEPQKAFEYTTRASLVAVISNGTAVLGLGDIGALASKPVMEGKCALFKKFADVDSIDICIDEKDPDKLIDIIKKISISFGAINLEDIKAPECFEIEQRLIKELDILLMHDDQHGTAIISTAGLINATKLLNKSYGDLKVVIRGAGASAISCGNMYKALGVTNIFMIDRGGVITTSRENLSVQKQSFARDGEYSVDDVFKDADVFLGLSSANSVSKEQIGSMVEVPIVFTMANPVPEILPEEVLKVAPNAIVGTGRSDYPNQVNNVLGFPFIFRAALDVRASVINEEMKMAASEALAELARQEVPQYVKDIYNKDLFFSKDYIIPTPFDKRVLEYVTPAIVKAAIDSGVARNPIDIEEYKKNISK